MLNLLLILIITPMEINWDGYKYYKPITDNFLFRPLGWKKPDSSPKYELIATIIGKDNKYIKAYIKDVKYGRDYFVGIGDNVGSSVVEEIHRGMVQLDDNTKFTQPSFGLLNTGTTRQKRTSRSTKSADSTSTSGEKTEQQDSTRVRQRTSRGRVGGSGSGGVDWQSQVQNFQNASPEERQQMIEQFRSMRGNRQGGRGRRGRDR